MELLLIILLLVAAVAAGVWLYIIHQGDAAFVFLTERHTPWQVETAAEDRLVVRTVVPYINKGTQDGTLMDVFPRCQVPQEYYAAARVEASLTNEAAPRTDGYWEANIVPKGTGGAVILTVRFTPTAGSISQALDKLVDLPIDIIYQVVARGPWYFAKTRLLVEAEQIRQVWQEYTAQKGVA